MEKLTDQEDIVRIYQRLVPAKETKAFMDEQREFNKKVEISMNDMKHDIKDLAEVIKTSNEQNNCQHQELLRRIGRIEQAILTVLAIFALAALYFIFAKTGLKI